jgi:hypothetical protein
MSMGLELLPAAALALLAIIAVAMLVLLAVVVRSAKAIGDAQAETQRLWTLRDPGPALHGLIQQTREVNRSLANIDKRLEKLEALEKVQIANMSLRDDPLRPKR